MTAILDDILKEGETALQRLCDEQMEETLHLEFKTLRDPGVTALTKDDKRTLARALSGMCNAEGGLLILGIETTKVDGIDCANALLPLQKLNAMRNRVASWIPDCLNPAHPRIKIHPVATPANANAGYLVIEIPSSESRPHMSMAQDHQKYFRRGSQGTVPMVHGEVRDLMLAERQARLSLAWRGTSQGSSRGPDGNSVDYLLIAILRNAGNVAARNPYLITKFSPGEFGFRKHQPASEQRIKPGGRVAVYSNDIIHVEDELELASARIRIFLNNQGSRESEHAFLENVTAVGRADQMMVFPGGSARGGAHFTAGLRHYSIECIFGAENAVGDSIRVTLDQFALVRLLIGE